MQKIISDLDLSRANFPLRKFARQRCLAIRLMKWSSTGQTFARNYCSVITQVRHPCISSLGWWITCARLEPEKIGTVWRHPHLPQPKKIKIMSSAEVVMFTVFWDARGVMFLDFLPKGQTINSTQYQKTLSNWLLQFDACVNSRNTSFCTAIVQGRIPIMQQPRQSKQKHELWFLASPDAALHRGMWVPPFTFNIHVPAIFP